MTSTRLILALSAWFMLTLAACASTESDTMVLGEVSAHALLAQKPGFYHQYLNFKPADKELAVVNSLPNGTELDVFFGGWCHDSEREIPRLLKLLESSKIPYRLYGLPYSKKDEQGLAQAAKVKFTPTIIVKFNGEEVGRIIERPNSGSLAQDIAGFLMQVSTRRMMYNESEKF